MMMNIIPFSRYISGGLNLQSMIAVMGFCFFINTCAEASFLKPEKVRETDSYSESSEMHLPGDSAVNPWMLDPSIFEEDQGDQMESKLVMEHEVKTIKLENLVPPIHFGLGEVEIPETYLEKLRKVLNSMKDRNNVRLHFVGHADSLKLRRALKELYGDNIGLSRERAGTVAEYCQRALNLPPEAISYEGLGSSKPIADNATEAGRQQNRRVEVQVWYDEIYEKQVEKEVIVPREVKRIKICRTETVCKLRYKDGHSHRARIKNMISPLHYERGMLGVPEVFIDQIERALNNLSDKGNIVVRFTAYTDDPPLKERDKRIYGNLTGLSRAVGRRVSLAVQDKLVLPNTAVEYEGRGESLPVASNNTEQGRALNRRVEVEFLYDDPLQDLPDEPQLCPDASGAEIVTRTYQPQSGDIPPILINSGGFIFPEGYTDNLRQILSEVNDKTNVRLRFVGYTSNKRLDRRTAAVYGDDIGLSMARARRVMLSVKEKMGLSEEQVEFDGRGYVQSDDVVNAGFIESDRSRVEVQVIYDDLVLLDDYSGVEITPITREVTSKDPFALNPMRITVDGKPLNDPGKCSSDLQRCTDVALDQAHIRFKHDSLQPARRLNVTAWPLKIAYDDLVQSESGEASVHFRMYSNYRSIIDHAEVRIFKYRQSTRDVPLSVIPVEEDGLAHWQPGKEVFSGKSRELQYLIRVYDPDGNFDETVPQYLWLVDQADQAVAQTDIKRELLAGYGESRIALQNIPIKGGTVTAYGEDIPQGYGVWIAGFSVPVDASGKFMAQEILPEGLHTVELAILDENGNGELYLRDLELKKSDWFTAGIADLSMSYNRTDGPAELLAPDKPQYSDDTSLNGRLAFYTKGKFNNGWSLTASADTGEGPLDDIFSNFIDKSSDALFRRIDPDYHYPTYGDDSTVIEDAPTSGKFYVKVKKDETYALWGNFNAGYTDNELAHIDRGLYGANVHYQPVKTTTFGEPKLMVEGFAADPGTVSGRDEFLGTGGSLYYLSKQDILEGSLRVRIEVRDKDSGIVLMIKQLVQVLDYNIDYLQGRILTIKPISPTSDDGLLVEKASMQGNPVYLVCNYEFTPGFEDPDTMSTGGRAHYWLNDTVKLGVTAGREKEADNNNTLGGVDLTLRKSAVSWIRFESAKTEGAGQRTTFSNDGGYNFGSTSVVDGETEAWAYKIDASIGLEDFFNTAPGQFTFYWQDLEKGYSAPGLVTAYDLTKYGLTGRLPVNEKLSAKLKADKREQEEGLETETAELDIDYRFGEHYTFSTGLRHEKRKDNSTVIPDTQEEGKRTDGVIKVLYDSHVDWTTYGFVQATIEADGNREDNNRIGTGGSVKLTDKFRMSGEISGGDLGVGGNLGTEYLYSDKTTFYQSYAIENDRSDNGLRARKGNITSGFRTRYSDSASLFIEERYTGGDVPSGFMHVIGMELAPVERLNLNANIDLGTLKDPDTNAELERKAIGIGAGYGYDNFKVSGALEYRMDNIQQTDATFSKQTSWLLKNSMRGQLSPDWSMICRYNLAISKNSRDDDYGIDYSESILGYAYRPVNNDRLNALFKYTFFYNNPTLDSLTDNSGFIQRSHIGSIDVMYDLTPRWTVGGKYAYRLGQLAYDHDNPEFFKSRAQLGILRADWHFLNRWDALIELRRLDLPDAEDSRAGALLGVYRHMGNHLKLGAGYNFTDFSDDLTNLDYRHQGFFINLIGKM
jgi:flagellar motor protein MotB